MKTLVTLLAVFVMLINGYSQKKSDFVVVDEIAEHVQKLDKKYQSRSKYYKTDGIETLALEQISDAIDGAFVEELHIFVLTKPGAIVFSSVAINPKNVHNYTNELEAWSSSVSFRVVIHSEIVFSGEEGEQLKQSLEEITGLIFASQK